MRRALDFGIVFSMVAFGITLAIIIGQRLSSEAMAVLLGVVTGIVSSIPTSLLIVWLTTRNISKQISALENLARTPTAQPTPKEDPLPRVIVMPQPAPAPQAGYPVYPSQTGWAGAAAAPATPPRRFTVIGETSSMED